MTSLLKRGSSGAAVRDLQSLLNAAGAVPLLLVDGDFGFKSEIAVRAFQQAAGLVIDGIVGSQTLAALKQATTPAKPGRQEPDKSAKAHKQVMIFATRALKDADPMPADVTADELWPSTVSQA
ncbi:peptidoglycan-binding domain-containing protein [Mesorhizobium sp. KR1-2]|uniref:peptidoglycan-binding domain-containing protein n=1 Tax=Mesorhizobium sp. KR1-2 TaxID=3156609 RepID=UPI0032B38F94